MQASVGITPQSLARAWLLIGVAACAGPPLVMDVCKLGPAPVIWILSKPIAGPSAVQARQLTPVLCCRLQTVPHIDRGVARLHHVPALWFKCIPSGSEKCSM